MSFRAIARNLYTRNSKQCIDFSSFLVEMTRVFIPSKQYFKNSRQIIDKNGRQNLARNNSLVSYRIQKMTATCRQKIKNDEYHTCCFCDFYIFGGLFDSLIMFLTSNW